MVAIEQALRSLLTGMGPYPLYPLAHDHKHMTYKCIGLPQWCQSQEIPICQSFYLLDLTLPITTDD